MAEAAFNDLDAAFETLIIADRNSVYFELLSIAQAIVDSPDVQELERRA